MTPGHVWVNLVTNRQARTAPFSTQGASGAVKRCIGTLLFGIVTRQGTRNLWRERGARGGDHFAAPTAP